MRSHIVAAPLVGIALVLAGCGGGDDEGLSKADYVAQADAICQKADDASSKELTAASQKLGENPTPEQQAEVVTSVLLPSIETQLKDLKALGRPKGEEDAADALYESLGNAVEKGKSDPSALISASGGESPFADANAKAKALGLKVCGASS